MKIGILGTGTVGRTLAARIAELGHEVTIGARRADSESLRPFEEMTGVLTGSFADAAAGADLVINATNGMASLEALATVGEALDGKTLLDLANELDASQGMPPRPLASADNSLAQKIQQAHPSVSVVKSLNTMNCDVMVDPSLVPGDHAVFVSGDDDQAKTRVKDLLRQFGWRDDQILDLGGIETAAAAEMLMHIWLRVMVARGGFEAGPFNFAVHAG
ncbi:MAG: NAD(P)-binding domain-containing protein [Actinobacteria bacterium]|nr:NAD(P)-binding domain-containing protein [Actinomycetota bacterium]